MVTGVVILHVLMYVLMRADVLVVMVVVILVEEIVLLLPVPL